MYEKLVFNIYYEVLRRFAPSLIDRLWKMIELLETALSPLITYLVKVRALCERRIVVAVVVAVLGHAFTNRR